MKVVKMELETPDYPINRTANVSTALVSGELSEDKMASECDFSLIKMPNESDIYDALANFSLEYGRIHAYLVIFICIFGSICSVCNIVVLTRPSMRTAVNTILCAIAFCDMIVMLSSFTFTYHYSLNAKVQCKQHQWSHAWAIFVSLHAQVSVIAHSSSIWLSIAMSYLRYRTLKSHGGQITVRDPAKELLHSYAAIAIVISCIVIFNVPNCLTMHIVEMPINFLCQHASPDYNATGFVPVTSPTAMANNCLLYRLAYWINGVVFKTLPCIFLTVFITILLRILRDVQRRRKRLLETSTRKMMTANQQGTTAATATQQAADRTTKMLITIICVFLATEFPQGLITVTTGIIGKEFRDHIYRNLGDLIDLLSLINSCLTFVIYCSMSKQYRNEFRRIFIPKPLQRLGTVRFRAGNHSNQSSLPKNNATTESVINITNDNPSVFVKSPKLGRSGTQKSVRSDDKNSKLLTTNYRPSANTESTELLPNKKGDQKETEDSNFSGDESKNDTLL